MDPSDPAAAAVAAAAAAAGLRHVVVPQGRNVAGPIPAERVLEGGQAVLVDDAWGRHLMVADEGEGEGGWGQQGGGSSSSYNRGLMARLASMGLAGSSGSGAATSGDSDGWGEVGHGDSDASDEEGAWADRYEEQQQQQGNRYNAANPSTLAPQGADDVGSLSSSSQPEAEANGSLSRAAAASSSNEPPPEQALQAESGVENNGCDEAGVPEEAEAAQAAAAGLAVAARADAGERSYGDGALRAMMRKVPL
jgi:hypothetical protein